MIKGIDISEWQTNVDYKKVAAAGIKFAILRSSYGRNTDKQFKTHVKGFTANNVKIPAVYHFSYALNVEDARKEALYCIERVKEVGLPDDTLIFYDFEYDTVNKAKKKGYKLGRSECIAFTKAFCETVEAAGYRAGIYCNLDYYLNMYSKDLLDKYVMWLADISHDMPSKDCIIHQYSFKGKVPGITGNVDLDYWMIEEEKKMSKVTAEGIIAIMRGWLGFSRSDGRHKAIIDLYNSHAPLARNYKVKYTDAYCATTVSAAFIKAGDTSLIGGTECSVENLINKMKKAGIWNENGSVVPEPGWVICYNWDDSTQPNDGFADHVGIVEKVEGKDITVIEGNTSGGKVARRTIKVGWGYIRGYGMPKYAMAENVIKQPISKEDWIKGWQMGMNASFHLSLKVDGIYGEKCKAAAKNHKIAYKIPTVENAVVSWLQDALNALGYTLEVDGSYGPKTAIAVKDFQKKHKLKKDGILGNQTVSKIMELI